MKFHFLCCALGVLFFVSCSKEQDILCFNYHAISPIGWEQHDVQTFKVDTVIVEGDYDFFIGLRSTNAYPFQSLWLLVQQQTERPDSIASDSLECRLTDRQGNELGNGVSLYQQEFYLKTLHLRAGQVVTVNVSHIMRRPILQGISDVGLIVRRKQQESDSNKKF